MMRHLKSWKPNVWVVVSAEVLLLLLVHSVWLFLKYAWALLIFPYPVDYGEGPVLDQVMRLASFQNIYRNSLTTQPFTVSNYPPLYHLLQVPFARLFGPAYWYGRGISILGILAAAIFIALTLHAMTGDRLASIVSGLLLPVIPFVMLWSPLCRIDSLALGLSWAGLYGVVRWPDRRRALIASGLLLTAAIFTRQSYALAAPFTALVWLLSRHQPRRAFELAAFVGGAALLIFLALSILTGGGFYFNIITANVNRFEWDTVWNYGRAIGKNMPYLVIGSLLFLLLAVRFRLKGWWLAAPYFCVSALASTAIGKAGSSVNYLFELSAAFSLLAGALIASVERRWSLKAALLLLLAGQVWLLYGWTMRDYNPWWVIKPAQDRAAVARLLQAVHEANGAVLADKYMGLVVLDGRPLYFQPFEFKQLALAGMWQQQAIQEAIRRKEFALILRYDPPDWDIPRTNWTDEQLREIEQNYVRVGMAADTDLYRAVQPGR